MYNRITGRNQRGNRSEEKLTEQEMEILQGTIRAVVYQNYDNGYAVLRLGVGGGQGGESGCEGRFPVGS